MRSCGIIQLTILCGCLPFFPASSAAYLVSISDPLKARANTAAIPASSKSSSLKVGFYKYKCPSVEYIVRWTLLRAVARNPGFAPGLIRMHFHDCFVRGCDASVLLDTISKAHPAERDSPANNPSLRGFEVINEAKTQVEHICPNTVSCADILAFAARDAAFLAGGISYSVPSGRRDGTVSLASEIPQNLPPPFFTAAQLRDSFARKNLTLDEMVTLSGAHSFGIAHCSSFTNRLYNFNATHPQDPTMDPLFAAFLKTRCPSTGNGAGLMTVSLDFVTPTMLDNAYYWNLMFRRGVLGSDQTLWDSALTAHAVRKNARKARKWRKKFGKAMVKMGKIGVLTGNQGQIRRKCNVVN